MSQTPEQLGEPAQVTNTANASTIVGVSGYEYDNGVARDEAGDSHHTVASGDPQYSMYLVNNRIAEEAAS